MVSRMPSYVCLQVLMVLNDRLLLNLMSKKLLRRWVCWGCRGCCRYSSYPLGIVYLTSDCQCSTFFPVLLLLVLFCLQLRWANSTLTHILLLTRYPTISVGICISRVPGAVVRLLFCMPLGWLLVSTWWHVGQGEFFRTLRSMKKHRRIRDVCS